MICVNGESEVLATGSALTIGWQVTQNGEPAVRVDTESVAGQSDQIRLHLPAATPDGQSGSQLLVDPSGKVSELEFVGLAADDGAPVVSGLQQGTRGVWRYDLQAGRIGKQLFWDARYDVGDAVHDANAAGLRGVQFVDDLPRMQPFDPADQRMQKQLSAAMPQAAPMLWSRAADGKRNIVKTHYSDHPHQWFLYNPGERRLDMIAPGYAALDGKQLPAKEAFDYSGSDGLSHPGLSHRSAGSRHYSAASGGAGARWTTDPRRPRL